MEKCTVRVRKRGEKRSDFFFFLVVGFSPCLAHIKLVWVQIQSGEKWRTGSNLKGEDVSARALLLCLSIRWSIILKVEEKCSAADGLQLAPGPAHCLHQPSLRADLGCALLLLPLAITTKLSVWLFFSSYFFVSFFSTRTQLSLTSIFIASFFCIKNHILFICQHIYFSIVLHRRHAVK